MSRDRRRAQRERMIAKRKRLAMTFGYTHYQDGEFAKKSGLGCPDGKRCSTCHPQPRRTPTRQELAADELSLLQ